MAKLDGKRALITGAGSGIGAESARLFARAGARVLLVGRTRSKLDATAADIRAADGEALVVAGDAAEPGTASRAVQAAADEWGGLDIAFLNAGTYARSELVDTEVEAWRAVYRNNVDSAFVMARAVVAAMVEGGGGVVLFNASTIGLRPIPGAAAYCSAKAAVTMLARTTALEYGAKGIRSLCIAPGIVDTPIHDPFVALAESGDDAALAERRRAQLGQFTGGQPIARPGTPADVARMALFLASDEADWMTGNVVCVDGGIELL